MTKPAREFWIDEKDINESPLGMFHEGWLYDNGKRKSTFLVREVLPNDSQESKVNWEKVWRGYDKWYESVDEDVMAELIEYDHRDKIQELVEKSLRNEL